MIAIYGVTGWLIAQERTGAVLAIQVLMNGVNIGLDLWFVLGLGPGRGGRGPGHRPGGMGRAGPRALAVPGGIPGASMA